MFLSWMRVLALVLLCCFASTSVSAQTLPAPATANVRDRTGQLIATAELREAQNEVRITLIFTRVGVLTGTHAIHIHERGACGPPDFGNAGAIFNPFGKLHGLRNQNGPMVGDLPDLVLSPVGLARYSV